MSPSLYLQEHPEFTHIGDASITIADTLRMSPRSIARGKGSSSQYRINHESTIRCLAFGCVPECQLLCSKAVSPEIQVLECFQIIYMMTRIEDKNGKLLDPTEIKTAVFHEPADLSKITDKGDCIAHAEAEQKRRHYEFKGGGDQAQHHDTGGADLNYRTRLYVGDIAK